tara:strand:- start:81650 stop:81991 length:342 start_codon:yes stop_codon:yes gene_type:complete
LSKTTPAADTAISIPFNPVFRQQVELEMGGRQTAHDVCDRVQSAPSGMPSTGIESQGCVSHRTQTEAHVPMRAIDLFHLNQASPIKLQLAFIWRASCKSIHDIFRLTTALHRS